MASFFFILAFIGAITIVILHFVFFPLRHPEVDLALSTATNQVYYEFILNKKFPDSLSIVFYPFFEYSHTNTRAVLHLFGNDKRKNTSDDIYYTWLEKELLPYRYIEAKERARIIMQTAYALCQRRLAKNEYPIWAPDLDTLVNWTDLPDFYTYTPFGHRYHYDVSSCKSDYCYCNKTIVWADDY
jgi:hypothetical protein